MGKNSEVVEQVSGYTRVYSLSKWNSSQSEKEQIIDLGNKNESSAFC